MNLRLAWTFVMLLCCGWEAAVAATPPPTKRNATPRAPPSVTLENKRHVPLQSFEIVQVGSLTNKETSVGRLEKPLAAGETIDLELVKPKGCQFEARWKFEDAEDSGVLDLCNDPHIVLVD